MRTTFVMHEAQLQSGGEPHGWQSQSARFSDSHGNQAAPSRYVFVPDSLIAAFAHNSLATGYMWRLHGYHSLQRTPYQALLQQAERDQLTTLVDDVSVPVTLSIQGITRVSLAPSFIVPQAYHHRLDTQLQCRTNYVAQLETIPSRLLLRGAPLD